eukprot:s1998_g1.t1
MTSARLMDRSGKDRRSGGCKGPFMSDASDAGFGTIARMSAGKACFKSSVALVGTSVVIAAQALAGKTGTSVISSASTSVILAGSESAASVWGALLSPGVARIPGVSDRPANLPGSAESKSEAEAQVKFVTKSSPDVTPSSRVRNRKGKTTSFGIPDTQAVSLSAARLGFLCERCYGFLDFGGFCGSCGCQFSTWVGPRILTPLK